MDDARRLYRRASVYYDVLDWPFEVLRYRRLRPRLWAGLHGRLLDLGAGTGRNAASYPEGSFVCAADLSVSMLARARRRFARAAGRAAPVAADAAQLPFADQTFDACVSTFLFCVMPDARQPAALREVRRVLKPDGRLILLEYVYSQHPWRRRWMKLLAPMVAFLYGARFDRRTKEHLTAAGLVVQRELRADGDVLLWIEAVPR